MDLWTIGHDAIRTAAARKAGLPTWRIGAVSVTSGLWATARVIDGPTVTVYERDVLLEDATNGTSAREPQGTLR